MIITKKASLLLPTVQFANLTLEIGATVDTDNPKDLKRLGLKEDASGQDASDALLNFIREELFASKDVFEEAAAKEFNLQVDFSKENARNESMKPKRY